MNRHLSVLIVDSDETVRELLRRILERADHAVVVAADMPGALALLRHAERPIDLVVADVPPRATCDAVADALRCESPGIPILLTSDGVDSPPSNCLELEKPFTAESFELRVAQAIASGPDATA